MRTATHHLKSLASKVGGIVGAVVVVIAVIFTGTSCTPTNAYVCKATYNPTTNPNGPAACINNSPVFAPPTWVTSNSPVPTATTATAR